jgi:hypothetical protein
MMKKKFLAIALLVLLMVSGCDHFGTVIGTVSGLTYSIQVDNQAAANLRSASVLPPSLSATAIQPTDTVELYIHHMEYNEDRANRGLILIADGDRGMGSKFNGARLSNAGWYSVHADLAIYTDVHNGPYSSFLLGIDKIRVNGDEYDFPDYGHLLNLQGVYFGYSTRWNPTPHYPNNFSGIVVNQPKTRHIKTVIAVDPAILDCWDGSKNLLWDNVPNSATDPYHYITVEGILSE